MPLIWQSADPQASLAAYAFLNLASLSREAEPAYGFCLISRVSGWMSPVSGLTLKRQLEALNDRVLLPCHNWSLSGMKTKASKPSKTVVSTSGSQARSSPTPRVSENPINDSPTAKIGFVSMVRSRGSSSLSSTPCGTGVSESSPPEEPTRVRYKRTASGELMRRKVDGSWDAATALVDWDRIESTTDAEIERQEIADLVESALQLQAGGLMALAARLDVSPSSVRRWRRARVMPSIAHQQRLHHLLDSL